MSEGEAERQGGCCRDGCRPREWSWKQLDGEEEERATINRTNEEGVAGVNSGTKDELG